MTAGDTGKGRRRTKKRGKDGVAGAGLPPLNELQLAVLLETFYHLGEPSWRSGTETWETLKSQGFDVTKKKVISEQRDLVTSGHVIPIVQLPEETREIGRLSAALRKRFRLRQVLLVPGVRYILDDIPMAARRSLRDRLVHEMVRELASHLDTRIATHLGGKASQPMVLGVAWGHTMRLLADHLLASRRPWNHVDLQVLPLIGITSALRMEPVEANLVAMDIARAYGGCSAQLPCPAFVDRRVGVDTLRQLTPVKEMRAMLKRCDLVITAMGPVLTDTPFEEIALSNDVALNKELFRQAREHGAVGEICGFFFDKSGNPVSTDYTAMGLGYEGLRAIALDPKRDTILIAGGDRRRLPALQCVLSARPKPISVLVTDTISARVLLGEMSLVNNGG